MIHSSEAAGCTVFLKMVVFRPVARIGGTVYCFQGSEMTQRCWYVTGLPPFDGVPVGLVADDSQNLITFWFGGQRR